MEIIGYVMRGLLGIAGLLAVAYCLSSQRKCINWRVISGGLFLQLVIAALLLSNVPGVAFIFEGMSKFFVSLFGFAMSGSEFVFGVLGNPETIAEELGTKHNFVFAFHALPMIIFFSALSSLLYYMGVLQRVVKILAFAMSRMMKLSGAESLAAAANVFVGQTEAPLIIKPYVSRMTRSELAALMVGGMATIAGSVFGAYVIFLGGGDKQEMQMFGKVLLCASLMNAPAALLIAKMLVPETEEVSRNLNVAKERIGTNAIDAVANGTSEGLKLALNVAAMLIAFIAIIAMCNFMLGSWLGAIPLPGEAGNINALVEHLSGGTFESLSLEAVCGFVFAPIAWLIGVGGEETLKVGQLIGVKVIANEFVAFASLGDLKAAGELSRHAVFLSTFALCGFANFASIGIQIGGIGGLAPERKADIARLGIKALIGGTLASLLSASVAGMFYGAGIPG
jgi:CNT family concentrative nucleoside transporter